MNRLRIIIAAAVATVAIAAGARDTEVSVSYGAFPATAHLGVYHNHWQGLDGWGAVNATIDHRFADPLWVGLSYTYSSANSQHASEGRYGEVTYHGLMVNVRYEWMRRSQVTLYSHVGVGVMVSYYDPSWRDSFNQTHMAFQMSPVGVQYDFHPNIGIFAEAGYGTQGVIKAGFRVGL